MFLHKPEISKNRLLASFPATPIRFSDGGFCNPFFSSMGERDRLSGSNHANHGKPWTANCLQTLEDLFAAGSSLTNMSQVLGRSSGAIIPKLLSLGLIEDVIGGLRVTHLGLQLRGLPRPIKSWVSKLEEKEKSIMENTHVDITVSANKNPHPPVENITYLYGQDIKQVTPGYLIKSIQRAQGEVATHQALPENNYSKKQIEKAQQAINLAVAELNRRTQD